MTLRYPIDQAGYDALRDSASELYIEGGYAGSTSYG
jgi:hypothetical protein